MPVRRVLVLLLSIALLLPGPPAFAAKGHEQVVDLTFPVAGRSSYGDSFSAARSGGRVHKATDIMAPEGAPIHAAVGGVPGARRASSSRGAKTKAKPATPRSSALARLRWLLSMRPIYPSTLAWPAPVRLAWPGCGLTHRCKPRRSKP